MMTECNKNPFPKKQVQVVKKTPKPIFNFSCKMITKQFNLCHIEIRNLVPTKGMNNPIYITSLKSEQTQYI